MGQARYARISLISGLIPSEALCLPEEADGPLPKRERPRRSSPGFGEIRSESGVPDGSPRSVPTPSGQASLRAFLPSASFQEHLRRSGFNSKIAKPAADTRGGKVTTAGFLLPKELPTLHRSEPLRSAYARLHVEVLRGGCHGGVTKALLDDVEGSPPVHGMGRMSVPEPVRRQVVQADL